MDLVGVSLPQMRGALAVAGLLLASACLPSLAGAQLLSPGPLARAHEELEGDGSCARCHATGRGIDTGECVECHDDVGARVRAGRGLHGREYRGRSCGECHVEHLGVRATLVRWPGGARERFDHAQSGWPLTGGHHGVECSECHEHRNRRGAPTFLGARTECTSCHQDPHESRFGNDCASCHEVLNWRRVRLERFDHGRTDFPLRGGHARVDCARCHHEPPRYRDLPHDRCSDCHTDPHEGRFSAPCSSCHTETSWTEVATSVMREQHPRLSLANGHARVECARCHDRGLDVTPTRGNDCVDCHRPVHEAPLGRDCARCHGGIRWLGLPDRIGERAHEQVPFRLTGAHTEVECAGCHLPSLPVARRFRQLEFDACRRCHEDRHDGAFASRDQGECGPCHTDASFQPSRFGVTLHATTRFPLEGRHEAVPCSACHTTPRPRTTFRVGAQACADCHENPHGQQFASEMAAGGCAQCHDPLGWNRPRIDHASWPLTGAHQSVGCERCHAPSPEDRLTGRGASYRGVPRECVGCHEDPHAGQFALSNPARQCADCHETAQFAIASFDHTSRTGFAIDGRHTSVACSGCHPSVTVGESTAVRWRLGYRRCADCHADPHAAAARGGSR